MIEFYENNVGCLIRTIDIKKEHQVFYDFVGPEKICRQVLQPQKTDIIHKQL